MAFTPKSDEYYRMPLFFGPTPGPRQFRGLERFDWQVQPRRRVLGARFLTDASKLQSWLPPGFEVWGAPVVNCEVTYFDRFGWLAGSGQVQFVRPQWEELPTMFHMIKRRNGCLAQNIGSG